MPELIFIGLGLFDDGGIPRAAVEVLKGCQRIFAEFYTSKLARGAFDSLVEELGLNIEVLDREAVENHDRVIEAFKDQKDLRCAFLCAGDPLTATTHQDLRIRAGREGITTRIIPAASIVSAAPALAGLSIYKFGRITTIPFPEEGYFPQSPYDVIRENLDHGCHTLVLLDIQADRDRYMTANRGLEYLLELEAKLVKHVLGPDTVVCVVARAGSVSPLVRAGYVKDMIKADFGPPLHCLMIPGTLHFLEAEALVEIGGAHRSLLEEG
jgi:diphthine synthase